MQLEVVHTNDGSTTLLNKELNATYHSKYGAMQESKHIFIDCGLNYAQSVFGNELTVLEIGFGTGLNAMLTLAEAMNNNLKIDYTAIEKYPVTKEIYRQLNYRSFISNTEQNYFDELLNCTWEKKNKIHLNFDLLKLQGDAREIQFTKDTQIIYFDAFAPSASPEMWQAPLFEKLFATLQKRGSLITFCAKGEVKRTLKHCGFIIEALPGPIGKREITRAIKP